MEEAVQRKLIAAFLATVAGIFWLADPVSAQGGVGSPSGTITLDGSQLPPAPLPFGGKIEDDALQSTPWWSPRVVPPAEAPNVLLIITDDAGSRCRAPSAALSPRTRWTSSPRKG
jgi:arylsulfatase